MNKKPSAWIFRFLAAVCVSGTMGWPSQNCTLAQTITKDFFAKLPDGWTIKSQFIFPQRQLDIVGEKLGGKIDECSNTVIGDEHRQVQINIVRCHSNRDAEQVHAAVLKMKQNPWDAIRQKATIFEFVYQSDDQARFAVEARYRLGVQPAIQTYRIQFDAAPVRECPAMSWNPLFNLFLRWESPNDRASVEPEIKKLAATFQFGDALTWKRFGQGTVETQWRLEPRPSAAAPTDGGDAIRFEFADSPTRVGVPFVHVEATVKSQTLATTPASQPDASLTAATADWPSADPSVKKLSASIVAGTSSDSAKVQAILEWFHDRQNMRVAGDLGSRYGTSQVLRQRYGNCWDYSDLMITFCRAEGIPARQVLGWIYGLSGHVWVEVWIEGQWRPLDPTTGLGCGSEYIPLTISEDGRVPFVYVSSVVVEQVPDR